METEFVKITVLSDEVQAQLLHSILSDMEIPHSMHSYHSRPYDGIFQLQAGWGHVAAPEERRDEIMRALAEMDGEAGSAETDEEED